MFASSFRLLIRSNSRHIQAGCPLNPLSGFIRSPLVAIYVPNYVGPSNPDDGPYDGIKAAHLPFIVIYQIDKLSLRFS